MFCSPPNKNHDSVGHQVRVRVTTQKGLGEAVSRPPEADRTTSMWCYITTSWEMKGRKATSLVLGELRVESE
ncbi:hypothetical protein A2U01_0048508, partial [Trifolium medium]|nr:hypothetical protein [Trifolium medium]